MSKALRDSDINVVFNIDLLFMEINTNSSTSLERMAEPLVINPSDRIYD